MAGTQPPLRTDQDKSILGQEPGSSTTITDEKTFFFGYPCQNVMSAFSARNRGIDV